ncbi:hypothetical protein DEA06_05335 [Microbacterium sp. Gd 4-13]|uniref:hypothetical protein n=1 Tax=Microbacterium sp. Gd 4-13 TaxID=2173179 RepID=UPI000D581FA3|nr:hypothetical protein [Microbacterium sp. Gd 4-13]PVW05183.1 hypothetical protein DEA06_05335 [Microbacterium sp. Gd 4-13]
MSGVAFDARPLTEPVDAREARAHARRMKAEGRAPTSNAAVIVVAVIVGLVIVSAFFTVGVGVVTALVRGGLGAAAVFPVIVAIAVFGLIAFLAVRGIRGQAARWMRLDRFARANGLTYLPKLDDPQLPGMIFQRGSSRASSDLMRGEQPRFVEFANYRYTTGSGKNRTTHRWGYVAVKLDVPLPHIILDAIGNNGLFGASNLPAVYDRDQRLSLEGDFDRHFALYCPQGYERDALYLFTPDIMARFIDNAAQLDVEIVDDWLFLYAKRDLSTLDPATWGWLFTVVAALLDKLSQWARWRDDRLAPPALDAVASGIPGAQPGPTPVLLPPPPGVAASGRRLKTGVPWVALIVFGVLGAGWLFTVMGGWTAILGR